MNPLFSDVVVLRRTLLVPTALAAAVAVLVMAPVASYAQERATPAAATPAPSPVTGSVASPKNTELKDPRTTPAKRSSWLEPRVSVRHTITNNVRRDASQTSDQITEVSPGLRWVGNTARVQGFADYSLRGFHYARGGAASGIEHHLNARATIEALEQRVFVDVSGVATVQPISAFGAPVDGAPASANPNATQTTSFGLSPYVRGRLGSAAEYEARYSVQDTRADTARRSDVRVQDLRLRVGNPKNGHWLAWVLEAQQEQVDFSLGRSIDSAAVRARLSAAITPQWALLGVVGVESTNQLSLARESNRITGFGVVWRPSLRTRLSALSENRYFGQAHNVLLEHHSANTIWRYSDTKGVTQGLGAQSASQGSLFDVLYGFYAQVEPDPILRTQRVLSEIDRLGLSADGPLPPDFLRSASTLQRAQQLSLALLGRRSVVTLALMQTDSRRLDVQGALGLPSGDDFDSSSHIRQRGWAVLLAHRLTPQTSVQAGVMEQRTVGSGGTALGQQARVRSVTAGLTTQLAPRTSAGVQFRRSVSDGRLSDYNESAVVFVVTHRF